MIHTSALVRITKASCHRHGYAVATLGKAGLIKARVKVKGVLSRYARAYFLPHCAALRKSASLLSRSALTANPPTADKQAHGLCVLRTAFYLDVDALRAIVTARLQVAVAVLGR
jgi:hypothetical protein